MKNSISIIIVGIIYLATFWALFLIMSLFGLLWGTYTDTISDMNWFIAYTLIFGLWVSVFPAREYYLSKFNS